mmetsp:Transcript_148400/g.261918  ORF Transcript_148400/g.261918 Transcript_148400/m.261918 type:complete len:239 (+) Transcript_148400:773-1489(+)
MEERDPPTRLINQGTYSKCFVTAHHLDHIDQSANLELGNNVSAQSSCLTHDRVRNNNLVGARDILLLGGLLPCLGSLLPRTPLLRRGGGCQSPQPRPAVKRRHCGHPGPRLSGEFLIQSGNNGVPTLLSGFHPSSDCVLQRGSLLLLWSRWRRRAALQRAQPHLLANLQQRRGPPAVVFQRWGLRPIAEALDPLLQIDRAHGPHRMASVVSGGICHRGRHAFKGAGAYKPWSAPVCAG